MLESSGGATWSSGPGRGSTRDAAPPGIVGLVDDAAGPGPRGHTVSTCPATLGPLHCTRETEHAPEAGCVYVSTSSAPDKKADAERRLEELYA